MNIINCIYIEYFLIDLELIVFLEIPQNLELVFVLVFAEKQSKCIHYSSCKLGNNVKRSK